MSKIKALVIGAGAIAHNCHLPGYQADSRCEIAAIADPNQKNIKSAMKSFDIARAYSSADDMLKNEDADCISVTSPNAFHADHAVAALKRGLHVLCEKPLCISKAEGARILRAAKSSKSLFMTAFTHRFFKGNQKARQMIEAGKIGKPYMIRVRFAHQGPEGWMMSKSFFDKKQAAGGALFDMGIHAIDLALWFMGPAKKINAMTATLEHKIAMEDNAIMQFEFKNGALGYAEAGWTSKQGFVGVEVFGSDAALVIDYNDESLVRIVGRNYASGKRVVSKKVIVSDALSGGWPAQMKYFLKCIRKGEAPSPNAQDGVDAVLAALASYESHAKGKTVKL